MVADALVEAAGIATGHHNYEPSPPHPSGCVGVASTCPLMAL